MNARTAFGQTPLHLAVRRGHDDVVTLLVVKGADVTAKDRSGKTPSDCARVAGRSDIVAFLTGDETAMSGRVELVEARAGSVAAEQRESRREPQTDVEKLVAGNCAFAVDLYQRLSATEGNLFFSPAASRRHWRCPMQVCENTEKEMAETLHFSLDQARLHPAFTELQGMLSKIQEAGNIKVHTANSLWPQVGHPFLKEYLSLIENVMASRLLRLTTERKTRGRLCARRSTVGSRTGQRAKSRT